MTIPLDWLLAFVLVFTRAGAMFSLIPIFSKPTVPRHVQLALAGLLSWMISPMVDVASLGEGVWNSGQVLLLIGKEAMVGLMMGFAARMVFFTAELAGQIMAQESGMSMSQGFDPVSGTTSTSFSRLLFYFTALLLFITGLHQQILLAFARSFEIMPVGYAMPSTVSLRVIVSASSDVFVVGTQIAAPVIAITFLVNLIFAVLGKAAPKMNVLMTSFSVRILVSFWLMVASIGLITQYLLMVAGDAPELMLRSITP